jgi:hypothetical protein
MAEKASGGLWLMVVGGAAPAIHNGVARRWLEEGRIGPVGIDLKEQGGKDLSPRER